MKRLEAEKLIGTKVAAWTAMRGAYVGELLKVIPARPFRAVIRVESISELPHGHRAALILPGAELEVGGVNIKPAPEGILGYHEQSALLIAAEERFLNEWEAEQKVAAENRYGRGHLWVIKLRREAVERFKKQAAISGII